MPYFSIVEDNFVPNRRKNHPQLAPKPLFADSLQSCDDARALPCFMQLKTDTKKDRRSTSELVASVILFSNCFSRLKINKPTLWRFLLVHYLIGLCNGTLQGLLRLQFRQQQKYLRQMRLLGLWQFLVRPFGRLLQVLQ